MKIMIMYKAIQANHSLKIENYCVCLAWKDVINRSKVLSPIPRTQWPIITGVASKHSTL